MKPLLAPLTLSLICLTACATDRSSLDAVRSLCPAIIDYGVEFRGQLAAELESLPDHPSLWRAMLDYGQLRAALRAC